MESSQLLPLEARVEDPNVLPILRVSAVVVPSSEWIGLVICSRYSIVGLSSTGQNRPLKMLPTGTYRVQLFLRDMVHWSAPCLSWVGMASSSISSSSFFLLNSGPLSKTRSLSSLPTLVDTLPLKSAHSRWNFSYSWRALT